VTSKLDIHTLEVIRKSFKSGFVKSIGMIASLLTSLFLARMLGAQGLGVINLANKLGMIFLILTMFGFQNAIIKLVAISKETLDIDGISSTLKTSLVFNGIISLLIASMGALLLPLVLDIWFHSQDMYMPLLIMFIMLIPQTISRVYGSALIGYGKIWQANLVNQSLSSLIVAFGLLLCWILDVVLTPVRVLVIYALGRVILVFVVKLLWEQIFKSSRRAQYNFQPMLKMAVPLLLVSGTGVIESNVDTIMLGGLGTLKDVGIYSVAARLGLLTALISMVVNSAISPKLASLYNDSRIAELEIMVQRVTKGLTFAGIVFVTFFILAGSWLLDFWGPEFREAYLVLIFISIGQFFKVATGASGHILIMCGHEKTMSYISVSALIFNIILNFIFIKFMGALGAAIATAITVAMSNVIRVYFVHKKLDISIIKLH